MEKILTYILQNKILKKLVLSKSKDEKVLRATGRLIEIKSEVYLAIETFMTDGKAIQKNIMIDDAVDTLLELVPGKFGQLNLITTLGDCEIKTSKKGKITVIDHIKKGDIKESVSSHNKKKKYILPENEPIDFLIALGVSDENGRIFDKKRSKFRQINKFLEHIETVQKEICAGNDVYILDLCCGKSYLSFALYYYFSKILGKNVIMDCVDLKEDVIEYCTSIAKKLNYTNLNFTAGDIRNFEIKRKPDLTVSLHACDIATDIVLAKAIDSGSRVILSTPCCHHEMFNQLKKKNALTDVLLEHSILKQKFTDALTDALRCKVLEINSYNTVALELIDPDETPKNVLIRAIKTKTDEKKKQALIKEYEDICLALGIEPFLQNYAK